MRSEVNFGHPKWPTAAILSKISKQMARNAIESAFRTSKMGAFNHFVKTFFLNFRIDLKWPDNHGNMVFSTHYILGTPQQSGGFLVCSVKMVRNAIKSDCPPAAIL